MPDIASMGLDTTSYEVRLARGESDLRAAQRLRYRVFVEELGGDGPMVNHVERLEADRFDPFVDHLLLCDPGRPEGEHVVGVYRLLRGEVAEELGQFYSDDEYDLGPLRASGQRLLELGRSCLDREHRGGTALFDLWQGLAAYVAAHRIDILFGVASFHGTDPVALAQPLSFLHDRHLAPEALRVRARGPDACGMDLLPPHAIDRKAAVLQIPQLIKSYLRLGGFVGEGAWVDHDFNTVDVCLILDTAQLNARQASLYTRGGAR